MSLFSEIDRLNDILNTKDKETKDKLFKSLDVDLSEKVSYFELNAQSFASGIIPLDISQFIYNKLRDYENTSLAERIVISQLMLELLQKRMAK